MLGKGKGRKVKRDVRHCCGMWKSCQQGKAGRQATEKRRSWCSYLTSKFEKKMLK